MKTVVEAYGGTIKAENLIGEVKITIRLPRPKDKPAGVGPEEKVRRQNLASVKERIRLLKSPERESSGNLEKAFNELKAKFVKYEY